MSYPHGGSHVPGTQVAQNGNHRVQQTHGGQYVPGVQPAVVQMSATNSFPLQERQPTGFQSQPAPQQFVQVPVHELQANSQYQQNSGMATYNHQQSASTSSILARGTSRGQENGKSAPKEKPAVVKGWLNIFITSTSYRIRRVHHYQMPNWTYVDTNVYRHRDFAGRVSEKKPSDRYLHHFDGYLRNLYVQCTDDLFQITGNTTWRRTYVRKVSPLKVRLATWVVDFSNDPESWDDWFVMLLRALPASMAISAVFWGSTPMRTQNGGYYASVPYYYHGEAKIWSNALENTNRHLSSKSHVYRLLKPRHLCFLRKPEDMTSGALYGVDIHAVDDWEATGKNAASGVPYLFVAYSTEQFRHDSTEDLDALHVIAETAARSLGLPAYWVACSCMREPAELENDVYRISDVLRSAQSMIIAVGVSSANPRAGKPDTYALLRDWGTRMWTFPEVLLSPGDRINVYTRGAGLKSPLTMFKNKFASQVWNSLDAEQSRQLADHFLGTLILSRLELTSIALRCLYARQTKTYLQGDQAYALMGLLRMRPEIDGTDSQFQAFARLSLANDSDGLLERYICTLPARPNQPWFEMDDAYHSSLWDISPSCQVAAICDNDTVVLDGVRGASIRWKSFYPVRFSTGLSWKRSFASMMLQSQGMWFLLAIIFFAIGAFFPPGIFLGIIFLLIWIYYLLMTPKLIRILYGGKFTSVQAELFGVEGYINPPTVERCIFGGNFKRMSWSTNGSPLSRFVTNEFGEREGVDPAQDPTTRADIEAGRHARPGDMRIFTLVDTYNMQLTLFKAVNPPVCIFLCGAEGGMQRAVACSYDWTTQTMYRETVLRMPTTSRNRMDCVSRFKFGLRRPKLETRPTGVGAIISAA